MPWSAWCRQSASSTRRSPPLKAEVSWSFWPCHRHPLCGRQPFRYTSSSRVHSMGSGDALFRTWSGPGGSSHKEPRAGARSHRMHCMSASRTSALRGILCIKGFCKEKVSSVHQCDCRAHPRSAYCHRCLDRSRSALCLWLHLPDRLHRDGCRLLPVPSGRLAPLCCRLLCP